MSRIGALIGIFSLFLCALVAGSVALFFLRGGAETPILSLPSTDNVGWARVGDPSPDFQLQNLSGQTVTLSEHRGKPVIINFWATWCGPCQNEMPVIEAASKRYSGSVVFLAVNVQETREQASQFVTERGLTFPILLDPRGTVSQNYRVRGLPTTFFVDSNGRLVEQFTGEMNASVVERRVRGLLD